tara:strand:+ start:544 stop:777 length:234 start_codon:yes stop_codon:yes gene_type:complete
VTAFFFPKSKSEKATKEEQYAEDCNKLSEFLKLMANDIDEKSDNYSPENHRIVKDQLERLIKKVNLIESKMAEDGPG